MINLINTQMTNSFIILLNKNQIVNLENILLHINGIIII